MQRLVHVVVSFMLIGCVSITTSVRNDDRRLRVEESTVSTTYTTITSAESEDGSTIQVRAREDTICALTSVSDRTVVTTRTISDKQRWQHIGTWVVGVAGFGALATGAILLGSEPAIIDHRKYSDSSYREPEITPTGHFLFWGALGTALLGVAIADTAKVADSRHHFGVVREPAGTRNCGQRNAANAAISVEGVGSAIANSEGLATFNLGPLEATLGDVEEVAERNVSVQGKAAGTTGTALLPFVEAAQARRAQEARRLQAAQAAAEADYESQRLETERARLEADERRHRLEAQEAAAASERVRAETETRRAEAEAKRKAEDDERRRKKADALRRLAEEIQ